MHWLLAHAYCWLRCIVMFSTGSSVCCRLAGREVLVRPSAARDFGFEMQAILGFKNATKYSYAEMHAWQSGEEKETEPNYCLSVFV